MRGRDLAEHAECGHFAAESLRADAERVNFCERLALDRGDVRARVVRAELAGERLFGKVRAGVEGAADADPAHDGRAGSAPRKPHRLHDAVDHALHALRRGEHVQA